MKKKLNREIFVESIAVTVCDCVGCIGSLERSREKGGGKR
jgi:hypothetical protein